VVRNSTSLLQCQPEYCSTMCVRLTHWRYAPSVWLMVGSLCQKTRLGPPHPNHTRAVAIYSRLRGSGTFMSLAFSG
jgi:hypothetical protein